MRLLVCGVRGSTPASGFEFARYGGHTSCVAVAGDGALPSLVLDAGTGLRRFSKWLAGRPFRGTILLGHLHWDHIQGLPFFPAAEHPDSDVEVLVPAQGGAEAALAGAMSPPCFPLRPHELRGRWRFGELEAGEREVGGLHVLALDIPHTGGRTFGFRVSDGSAAVAYLSDHNPIQNGPGDQGLGPYHEAALALAAGVDLLIHDAQHTAAELPAKAVLGHSAIDYAVGLGRAAGARRVLLYHHDPDRTDDEIDAIVASQQDGQLTVEAANEGSEIQL